MMPAPILRENPLLRNLRCPLTIAIEEIDRIIAAGVRCGSVLADAGYGLSAPFRQALSELGLHLAVGILRITIDIAIWDRGLSGFCPGKI